VSNNSEIKIVPSVLPADFANLGKECAALEEAGVDRIQFDIMDGQFVPNLTFGPDTIASVRSHTSLPFEAHLMTLQPEQFLERFIDAGCEMIIVHAEACTHLHKVLAQIKELGANACVALNPHTPIQQIESMTDLLDMILIMTINPGFGGQKYLPLVENKIRQARELADAADHEIDIEVDGGINNETIKRAAKAGANVFISGTTLYKHPEGLTDAVKELRSSALEAM